MKRQVKAFVLKKQSDVGTDLHFVMFSFELLYYINPSIKGHDAVGQAKIDKPAELAP
jgi:hypothetical protein